MGRMFAAMAAAIAIDGGAAMGQATCDTISKDYRIAQVALLSGRLDVYAAKSAVQQSTAYHSMTVAQNTMSIMIGLAAMHGCRLAPPAYPLGEVDQASDAICGLELARQADAYPRKQVTELSECSHWVAAVKKVIASP